jgi:hypothetical protein
VHGFASGDPADPPGLTPLSGQYRRPDELWACYRTDVPQLSFLTDHDASDGHTRCVRVTQAAGIAKLVYYGAKLYSVLKSLPPPPP